MKLRKRIIAGFLSALFILCSVSLPVAAAADPYTWDGTSVLAADRTYYIKSNITLGKSLICTGRYCDGTAQRNIRYSTIRYYP